LLPTTKSVRRFWPQVQVTDTETVAVLLPGVSVYVNESRGVFGNWLQ
jgi:hypothetical protein